MGKYGLSIVMPCLNEEKTLGTCINKAKKFLSDYGIDGEIVIADNGSTDNSRTIANDLGARVVNIDRKGYGSALQGGIAAAEYDYIVMGDADDSYDFLALDGFIQKLDEGYDLVMGNRFKGGIEKGAMPFSHQYIGNPFLSGIGKLFFKAKISDFHCGLRAFRKDSIEKLNLCTTGMEFASEMVVKAHIHGLKVTEIPCKLYPDGRDRPPHLRSIPDGFRHLEFLLIYSPKWLFAYPGIILFVLGLIFTVSIYIHPIQIGRVEFEATSMLYSAIAMLLGFQMLQFSVFTNLFGIRIGQFPNNMKLIDKIKNLANKCGYIVSTIVMLVGIVGIIYTLCKWGQVGFGELTTNAISKTATLFGSLFALGMEMLLFTVFVRVLQMGNSEN